MTEDNQPPIDYSQFHEESLESWETIWRHDLQLWENFANILQDSVLIPNASIQVPLAIAYICAPSAICNVLPILFCHGRKAGTGKSTLGKFAAYAWGVPVMTSSDTFASVRNHLLEAKYLQYDGVFYERNTILVLDDIDKRFFQDKVDIYRLFKFGYDRATDTIQIAGEKGSNLKFRCFCGRIVSSVSPLYADPDFPELQRRCFVLKFKKFEDFKKDEIERFRVGNPQEGGIYDAVLGGNVYNWNVLERLNLDAYSWRGFEDNLINYWKVSDNCKRFQGYRRQMNKQKKSFVMPDNLTGEQWTISTDVLCSGLTLGIWRNLQDAVSFLGKYWEWAINTKTVESSATLKILRELIESETAHATAINNQAGREVYPLTISPKRIKAVLDEALKCGELDLSPSIDNIKNCMAQLGWKLDVRQWVPDKG